MPFAEASGNEVEIEISKPEQERRTLKRFTTKEDQLAIRELTFGKDTNPEEEKKRNAFIRNEISTAKYNLLTFFPVNLFEQIIKLANAYFLFLSIFQCIPSVSITDGKPTLLVPLSVVIIVSMIKDFVEDRKRQNSDTVENNSQTLAVDSATSSFRNKRWKDIRVGDIVKVLRDNQFPADIVVLNSSAQKGICYVETKNLDGETNLKHKMARAEVLKVATNEASIINLQGTISCEMPSPALYSYEGAIKIGDNLIPLSSEQLLLRGSSLKNTDFVYGIVVFTGPETKIMKNSSKAKSKRSNMESLTNKQIIFIFIFQIAISLICAIGTIIWLGIYEDKSKYLEYNPTKNAFDGKGWIWAKCFFSWLLMTVY